MIENLTPRDLVRLIIHTDKLHRNLVEKRMAKLNLHRSQHMMLICINGFDIPPTQREIADKLGLSAATVAITVKKLECAEYIIKTQSDGDSRCNRIIITEKGKSILDTAQDIFSSIDSSMFSGLSDSELSGFVSTLSRIQDNLKSHGAELEDPCHGDSKSETKKG